MTEVKLFRF